MVGCVRHEGASCIEAVKSVAAVVANELAGRNDGTSAPASAEGSDSAETRVTQPSLNLLAMLDSAADGILVADIETKHFVFANAAIYDMLGYTADELSVLKVEDIHPPAALGGVKRHFQQIVETGRRNAVDHEVKRKDGSTFYATISTSPLASGGRAYAVGFFHDITERKRSADALAYRDKALHAVMFGTSHLLGAETFNDGVHEALHTVGEALNVDRVVVVRQQSDGDLRIKALWERDGIAAPLVESILSSVGKNSEAIARWREPLRSGRVVVSQRDAVAEEVGQLFDSIQACSILLVPISTADGFWGNIGLDTCRRKREWSVSDIDVVTTFASLIGALIVRDDTRNSLRHSEERFRAVSETARDAIVIADLSGRVRYWNPAAERMFGYSADEVGGKGPISDWLIPPGFQRESRQVIGELAVTNRPAWTGRAVERSALRRDGTEVPIELSVQPLMLSDEQLTVALMHDISERKEAEAALIASEAQLSNALKMARAGHWVYDVARDEFTFNDNFYALFRTTAAEVGGYTMRSTDYARRFCHPDDAPLVGKEVAAAINTTDPEYSVQLEHRAIFGDGQPGWIAVRFFVVKDDVGKTVRTYGVNQDITERKKGEEALRRLNRTLRTLSSTNHALVHATDEHQLSEQVSRVIVEIGSYAMAWVGLRQPSGDVKPIAYAGAGAEEYLRGAAISSTDIERGRGANGDRGAHWRDPDQSILC